MALRQPENDDGTRRDRGRRELLLFLLILLLGFLCLLCTAQVAVNPRRSWLVSADMLSRLDSYLTVESESGRIAIAPLRPEVMTLPPLDLLLTPQGTPVVISPVALPVLQTSTATLPSVAEIPTPTATPTSVPLPPTDTPTPTPTPTHTSTPEPTPTSTGTSEAIPTTTITVTPTPSRTATSPPPDTPTPSPTVVTPVTPPTDTSYSCIA